MDVKEVRAKFPSPVALAEHRKQMPVGSYCVAGAAIMFKRECDPMKTDVNIRFPKAQLVMKELGISYDAAWIITGYNDAQMFDVAWATLEGALEGANVPTELR